MQFQISYKRENRWRDTQVIKIRVLRKVFGKFPRARFLEKDRLFCFISNCKFGSFKNPFAVITSLSEPSFRFKRFILSVQTKKVISINYGSSTSSLKPWTWVRLDLVLAIRVIYINSNLNPLTKFTSSRSTEFRGIPHGTYLKWSQRPSQLAWQ